MRKTITLFISLALLFFIVIRCSTSPNSLDLENNASDLTGKYDADIVDSKLYLHMILENDKHIKVLERRDTIDLSKGYRLRIAAKLKEIASQIMSKTVNLDSKKSILSVQTLIDTFAKSYNATDMANEEVQGLFYYLAIFKMINRYNEELSTNKLAELKCTTYNGYIVGLSPYHAKEDIIINTKNLKEYLSAGNARKLTSPQVNIIVETLNNYSLSEIALSDLENEVEQDMLKQSKTLKTAWLEGGDCGCCGNYEGVCWFANDACYIHDYLCQDCKPQWFCFKGCKPTPCTPW